MDCHGLAFVVNDVKIQSMLNYDELDNSIDDTVVLNHLEFVEDHHTLKFLLEQTLKNGSIAYRTI